MKKQFWQSDGTPPTEAQNRQAEAFAQRAYAPALWLQEEPLFMLALTLSDCQKTEPGAFDFTMAAGAVGAEKLEDQEKDNAIASLARELCKHNRNLAASLKFWKRTGIQTKDNPDASLCAAAGTDAIDGDMLDLDRLGAEYLASLGTEGKDTAEHLQENSRNRWKDWKEYKARSGAESWLTAYRTAPQDCPDLLKAWRPDPDYSGLPGFFQALAKAVWLDLVKPRLVESRRVTTTNKTVLRGILTAGSRGSRLYSEPGGMVIEARQGQVVKVKSDAWLADRFQIADLETMRRLLEYKFKTLGTPTGLRTLVHLVKIGNRHFGDSQPAPALWEVDGGLDIAAKQIGLRSNRDTEILRDTLDALSALVIPLQGDNETGHWNLLSWDYRPARGQSRGLVRVTIWEPLAGANVHRLIGSDRLLTPVPDIPAPDSKGYVGDKSTRAAQALFHLHLSLFMADRSRELAKRGGIEITDKDWDRLAEQAELPRRILQDLLRAYQGSLWPVLKRLDSGLWIPADPKVLDFLTEQGRIRENKSKSGKISAKKRK